MSNSNTEIGTVDRVAMLLGGGLVLLGTIVLGFLDTFIGNPFPMPVTNEAGEIIANPTFSIEIRGTIIALGLAVFALYAVYKVFAAMTTPAAGPAAETGVSMR